jgi:hypothetical protein
MDKKLYKLWKPFTFICAGYDYWRMKGKRSFDTGGIAKARENFNHKNIL